MLCTLHPLRQASLLLPESCLLSFKVLTFLATTYLFWHSVLQADVVQCRFVVSRIYYAKRIYAKELPTSAPAALNRTHVSMMHSSSILVASFAIGVYSQFLSAPTDLTTTKGYAGYNVRWKKVPTGPNGICELVGL